jgi:LysR family nitrogen assimilation transcriptional regulator
MNIKQLEYFCQVAELGSFSHASAFLDISQPTLSRQIRDLEVELEASLFERHGRGVTLTAAGERMLKYTRMILRQIDQAKNEVSEHRNVVEGRLVLGWPPSLGRTATVPLVEAFHAQYPKVMLSLVEGLSTHVLEWLAIGRVDCAVVYNPAPTANIDLVPLAEEPLYLLSPRPAASEWPPRASMRLEEMADLPFIIPSRPNNIRLLVEQALATVERKINVRYEIESIPAIHELVRRGHGHAVLPLNAIGSDRCDSDDRLTVRAIEQPELATRIWLATSSHRPCNLLTQRALQLIGGVIREQIAARSVAVRVLMP